MNLEEKEFIMQRMTQSLDNRQMIMLMHTLDDVMKRSEDGILEKSSEELLDVFLATKRLEGRSDQTIFMYRYNLEKLFAKVDKNVCVMTAEDIREYLSAYQEDNGVSKVTIDNVRRVFSTFLNGWKMKTISIKAQSDGYIR